MAIRRYLWLTATFWMAACGLDRPADQLSFETQFSQALAALKFQPDLSNPARNQAVMQRARANLQSLAFPQADRWKCKVDRVLVQFEANTYMRNERNEIIWNSGVGWGIWCQADVKYVLLLGSSENERVFVASLEKGTTLIFSGGLRKMQGFESELGIVPVAISYISR